MNWDRRFKAVSQSGPLAKRIFRVAQVDPQDMILWSEAWVEGPGMTWRGSLAEFKKTFTLAKVGTG